MSGFKKLTEVEVDILRAFTTEVLVLPDVPHPLEDVLSALKTLKSKGFIYGSKPWILSDKGKRYKQRQNV